ncbi:MAG: class F sortase [Candidatus Paceibacterota bacterium]|jgi:LPXTG-site transpeptidase (sortase) family protein
MQDVKKKLYKTKLIILFVGIIFSSVIIYSQVDGKTIESKQNINPPDIEVGLPVRLKIPRIKINSIFEHVGLTPEGAVDSPKGPSNVAYFTDSPRPGEIGSSIIDGHSGWKNNIPAVFDNLYKLRKGDRIYVEDDKGNTITFIVREIRKYNPNADAIDVFSSNDGKAHLNLITCTGIWNKVKKSRSERLVVFTDREIK